MNVQVDILPALSVAVAVTVVVPIGNKNPEGCDCMTSGSVQLSLAIIRKVTFAPHTPGSLLRTIFTGHAANVGASSSVTMIV